MYFLLLCTCNKFFSLKKTLCTLGLLIVIQQPSKKGGGNIWCFTLDYTEKSTHIHQSTHIHHVSTYQNVRGARSLSATAISNRRVRQSHQLARNLQLNMYSCRSCKCPSHHAPPLAISRRKTRVF